MYDGMKYLRVSLLPACNFNCTYCRPVGSESGHPSSLTPVESFKSAITCLHKLGIRKVRFTGGEPTLYPSLVDLVAFTKSLTPTIHIALTTNAQRLGDMARELGSAGLDSVNISLDTLESRKFEDITGRDCLDEVLAGIDAAREWIPSVKLNTVVLNGVNADEAVSLIRFGNDKSIDVRFIEYMPTRDSMSQPALYLPSEELRGRLPFELKAIAVQNGGAARYFTAENLDIRVGFIEAVSRPFCETCDRIRLTAEGDLFGCLFSGLSFNLFEMMSGEQDDIADKIEELVRARTNLGCSTITNREHYLPAFVVTGG